MTFHRHRAKTEPWRAWVRKHHDTLAPCGLPESVLRDQRRWYSFLDHGYCPETGWSTNLLSPKAAQTLFNFLVEECGDSIEEWCLRDLRRVFTRDGSTVMDQHEWSVCTEPERMLAFLADDISERQLRLFAAACCRRIGHLLSDCRTRNAVEVAERYADGRAATGELRNARATAVAVVDEADGDVIVAEDRDPATFAGIQVAGFPLTLTDAIACAHDAAVAATQAPNRDAVNRPPHAAQRAQERAVQCQLLRCIVGDPFRTMPVPSSFFQSWDNATAASLADAIYDERAFDRMPILADALEEAGCIDEPILIHCRDSKPHARGCWVLDLVLDKA